MIEKTATKLHGAISAVCPIHGVSIGDPTDKATWRVDFTDNATEAQRVAALAALDGFEKVSRS